jgi:hypothetical protein
LQWTRTFDPPCKMQAMDLNSFFQVVSKLALGTDTSATGQWYHSICRRRTCWPMSAMSRASSSCGSTRVSTAAAFHAATASRSVARSRCHGTDLAPGCFLPGAKVTPTSPSPAPTDTSAICSGWDWLVRFMSSRRLPQIKGSGAAVCRRFTQAPAQDFAFGLNQQPRAPRTRHRGALKECIGPSPHRLMGRLALLPPIRVLPTDAPNTRTL